MTTSRAATLDRLALVRSSLARATLLLLPLFLLGLGFAVYHLFDFHVFWQSGREILHGSSPYPPVSSLKPQAPDYYVYPPFVALAVTPLAALPFPLAGAVFSILLLGALLLTPRLLGVEDWRCYGAPLLWVAALQAVATGTITPLLVVALAISWRWRERPVVVAACLAPAIAAKFFLWPLLAWLAATRRGKAAALTVAGGAALVAVSWAAVGFKGAAGYLRLLRRFNDLEQKRGYSIPAFAHGLGATGSVGTAALFVATLAGLTLVVLLARRAGDRAAFVAAIGVSLAVSPVVWLHYFALLLVPIALAYGELNLLWLTPAILVFPDGDSGGAAWRIAIAFAVTAVVCSRAIASSREPHVAAKVVR